MYELSGKVAPLSSRGCGGRGAAGGGAHGPMTSKKIGVPSAQRLSSPPRNSPSAHDEMAWLRCPSPAPETIPQFAQEGKRLPILLEMDLLSNENAEP